FLVTAFAWPGFLRGRAGGGLPGKPPSADIEQLLAHMPENPLMVIGIDLCRLENKNRFDELLVKLPKEVTNLMQRNAAINPSFPSGLVSALGDVQAIVIATDGTDKTVVALKTKTAYKKDDLFRNANVDGGKDMQGKNVYKVHRAWGGMFDLHVML